MFYYDFALCVCVPGKNRRREAADDQIFKRGAPSRGGSSGIAQEAPTESNAERECGAEGQYCCQ